MISKVIINGREVTKNGRQVSYEELVAIATPSTHCPDVVYTVTYNHGVAGAQGELVMGESVRITDRMIFNVADTSNG